MTQPGLGVDTAGMRQVAEVSQRAGTFEELGVTGLKRSAGYLDEEFLPQLKGRKALQVYREMSDNDPIVGSMLFAIDKLIRNADFTVQPAGKSRDHAQAAKLVETCKDDMSHSWDEMLSEILSSLVYGWSWHEIVYKRRVGPWEKDGRRRSQYTDGLVGWRKMPIRAQETMQRWVFDESGGIQAMVQMGPPDYAQRILPIERSLLFRYGISKGSPEGRSILRNAYRPWFYKKRIEEFEAVGVERDLAGLPMVKVPSAWLKARPGSPEHKQLESFKKMVRGMRRNEQEGLVFPLEYDVDTRQPLFEFELLGGGSARQFQTDPLIQRYEQRILMTVLADWIMVGHQATGTYNMHLDKTGIFRTALNSTAKSIADVFNRHAIPRLFAANGWKPAELPKFVVSDVDAPDLAQLGQFLTATAGLGYSWGPDADLEKWMRQAAGMPELPEGDYTKHRRMARQEEATRFAESQARYLAARSELAQMQAQEEMAAAGEMDPEMAEAQVGAEDRVMQQQQAAQQQEMAGEQANQQRAQFEQQWRQAEQQLRQGPTVGSKK